MLFLLQKIYSIAYRQSVRGCTLSFLLIMVFSCSNEQVKNTNITSNGIDITSSTLELYLDSFTSFGPEINISGITENNNIIFTNTINHSIDYYSLTNGNLAERIDIPKEGVGGIELPAGALELSEDSILIFNKFVLNEAKVLNKRNRSVIDAGFFGNWNAYNDNLINVVCSSLTQPILFEDKIYLLNWPLGAALFSSDSSPIIEFEFDRTSKLLAPLPVHYPEIYFRKKHQDYLTLPMRTYNPQTSQLVYSWPLYDGLGIWNIVTKDFNFIKIKDTSLAATTFPENESESWKEVLESLHYNGILFDSINKLYYRFYFLPIKDYSKKYENEPFPIYHMTLGIQVIDINFKELGIIKTKGDTYDFARSFVHKGKLYLSKNNMYNKDLEENILKYDVIEIQVN